MMFSACLRIVRNRHDAEDIVQESFVKGFQKMGELKEETNCEEVETCSTLNNIKLIYIRRPVSIIKPKTIKKANVFTLAFYILSFIL
jgi:hypothetical protein